MLQFFRINDPYRLVFVFLILVILRILIGIYGLPLSLFELKWLLVGERLGDGFLMYKETYDYTSPLAVFVYKSIDFVFGKSRFAHQGIATVWIFVNAASFNLLLVRNRVYKESNYLPSLFFVLIACTIPDFMALSPQLMASTFIIMSLNNVFRRIDNEVTDELFLYSGIYLGIAGLFYFPAVIYFLIFLLSFVLFSNPIIRRVLLYLYGFLIPFLVTYCYFYWFENEMYLLNDVVRRGLFGDPVVYLGLEKWWLVFAIPLFWGLLALFITFIKGRFTNFENKISQVMFLLLLGGVGVIWLDVERSPTQAILFLPVISFFLTHYILLIKKRLYKVVVPFLLLSSLIATPYFVYPEIESDSLLVGKSDLVFENKKIMVLGDDISYYHQQQIAGPFIDPSISQSRFEYLDFYQSAHVMYRAIDQNLPEVIIDEWLVLDKIFHRFPQLEEKYRAGSNNKYYLKINN